MADKRIPVIQDPDATRTVLATVPFAGLGELLAALQWLQQAPHLNGGPGGAKHPVSIDIDKAGANGEAELCSYSRPPSKDNFYGEEINIAYMIAVKKPGAA